ncbi:helix-turn-helix domain-containing protein [Riemerella columbina]|uniref:helix-turn-helix domain-containing protein n=1 Tax=Riemerella columbina TaxID=103810 RepID=UPI00266F3D8A|nr:helix-turn-helix transcriptional regulator [Riemerella columbina]WKS94559.1 helix-turn-helix domain-containing protein [Riemerella columbina]
MNLNDRISEIIKYSELTASDFADEIDVQRSSISHITSGRNKPSLDFIVKIKNRFPEIAWDWLINGEGEMLISQNTDTKTEESTTETEEPSSSPLLDLFSLPHEEAAPTKPTSENHNPRESFIPTENQEANEITPSQPLENFPVNFQNQDRNKKIKRVIIFFENGKFESYEL